METKANHLLVGGFVLGFALCLVVFVLWLGKATLDENWRYYRINFEGSVTGLQVGNPVRYRGVPVGSVDSVRINPANVELVEVVIRVNEETPIKEDTEASLGMQGITGVAYVQLAGGTQEAAVLVAKERGRLPEIPSRRSGLEQVMEQAPQLLERALELIDKANGLLGEENQRSIAGSLANLAAITGVLADSSGDVRTITREAAGTMTQLNETVTSLSVVAQDLQGRISGIADDAETAFAEAPATVREFRAMATSFRQLSVELETLVADNRRPIQDFTGTGLYEISQLVTELRTLTAALTRVTERVEQNPARFFFGDSLGSGVELRWDGSLFPSPWPSSPPACPSCPAAGRSRRSTT